MPASVSREQWFEAAKTGDLAALERWHKAGVLKAQRFDPHSVTARAGEGRPSLARLVNGNQQGDLDALDTALFHYHIAYAIRLLELERFPPVANPALFTPWISSRRRIRKRRGGMTPTLRPAPCSA